MPNQEKTEPKNHKHEPTLLLLCLLTSSLAGYIITHYIALIGA